MKHLKIFLILAVLSAVMLGACSDDGNKSRAKDYATLLTEKKTQLETLRKNAPYGIKRGEYPVESRTILDDAIVKIGAVITSFDGRSETYEAAVSEADKSIYEFKLTMFTKDKSNTEDFEPEPAELLVKGNNGAGYIDFGIHEEYSNFGERGRQKFTVELWIKLATTEGFGSILGCYADLGNDDTPGSTRSGWFVNNFGNSRLRMSLGMEGYGLREPGFDFSTVGEWVHFAAVIDEEGVDGETDDGKPIIVKVYKNGELMDRNNSDVPYLSNANGTNLIGFLRPAATGGVTSDWGISGYMKHIRIWKSAKTADEISRLMNNLPEVTGNEPDLVCGWEFTSTVADDTDIPDITGRYSAKLVGNYQWRML